MQALVVGGTGPTGPFIVNGLRDRGYHVTIFHRGTHEIPEIPEDVEHIHGDPHFRETIDAAIGSRSFDLVVATYGRIRHVAEAMIGRTGRFVAVGGFATYRGFIQPSDLTPAGLPIPVREDAALVATEEEQRFSWLMASTEEAVMKAHPGAAMFRYPYVYGPYQLVPREWCVIRRILDGRRQIVLPDAGLALLTHGYAENLAHGVLLAVDQPEVSAGQIYNCGDDRQLSLAQIVELIAHTLDREIEIINLPHQLAFSAGPLALGGHHHTLLDLTKIRNQLGYRDVVPAEEALVRTTRWYVEHPPEPGGEIEERLGDPFDYAAEDELIGRFQAAMSELAPVAGRRIGLDHHPYPHPTEAGLDRDHRNR
ncbi:MAG: NAD-dependent epimerase/dehydratase family protein [Deltaproteobacteria bacterium]|nr:NAD-dependent epimerase/dehydratase family protein [Deltaproteobacteria bacterium]